mmetsp:Transcript_116996/g.376315  ORF Transcript_116996/g.376315 Transcript_116996/m.376315 type:complete len:383 (-) Transcript_116996:739-1887(-)
MLHTLELRLDVLLGDLQQPQDTVVRLLGDHVQDVAEALRAALPPSLVHTEGHVLRALLPTQELHIGLALVNTIRVVEAGAWEHTHDLSKFHDALRQRGDAMFQVLERLLVDLGVQHIVHRIHLCLPILLVNVPLLLHLPRRVAVLLDVHLVRGALHRQAIDLLAKLQDVALVLTETTLHTAHAQVKSAQPPRGFCAAKLRLLLNGADLLKGLLLLLPDVVFQTCLRVSNVALQVAAHHCHLVEAIAQGILRCVQALLRSSQVLVREVNAAVQGVHGLVRVAGDLGLGLLQVRLHSRDVVPDGGQDLVHLATTSIHIQAQRGDHVAHRLDGSVKIVVGLLPSDIVYLGVQLRVHLVLQVDDILGQVLLLLLHLLQSVRHILHP